VKIYRDSNEKKCLLCSYLDFDEQRYVNALAPLLTAQGFPAHFIIDQGRSGVQPTSQLQQGDWCNVRSLLFSSVLLGSFVIVADTLLGDQYGLRYPSHHKHW
jgi:hypothetical protein